VRGRSCRMSIATVSREYRKSNISVGGLENTILPHWGVDDLIVPSYFNGIE